MKQPNVNPALMQAQLKAKMKQALDMDKELEKKTFVSEDEGTLIQATGLARVSQLGFRLDNGEFLSEEECARLLHHLNNALGASYEFRNRAAKALFGEISEGKL